VKLELAQVVSSAWPLGVSLAAAGAAQAVYATRRRSALNEALHELRRPMQALVLAPGTGPTGGSALEGSVQMVAAALERLEREINGEASPPARVPLDIRSLLAAAVGRWGSRAALAGAGLRLCWQAGEATVEGDRCAIAQTIDNLIVNAIEHGGREIAVEAEARSGCLLVVVRDSGCGSPPGAPQESPAEPIARLLGRRRRGHGLRVVRRTAAEHGGDFLLRCSEQGTEAVLELPLQSGGS
jgi:signal transduction histidine kinase